MKLTNKQRLARAAELILQRHPCVQRDSWNNGSIVVWCNNPEYNTDEEKGLLRYHINADGSPTRLFMADDIDATLTNPDKSYTLETR